MGPNAHKGSSLLTAVPGAARGSAGIAAAAAWLEQPRAGGPAAPVLHWLLHHARLQRSHLAAAARVHAPLQRGWHWLPFHLGLRQQWGLSGHGRGFQRSVMGALSV